MRRVSSVLSSANSPTSMMMMMMIVAAEKNYEVWRPTTSQHGYKTQQVETDVALGVATPVLP